MSNASLIPHQLFGENGMIKDIGEIAVPIIASISKRTNSHRQTATLSTGLIMNDFNISLKNTTAKKKITDGLEGLMKNGLIDVQDLSGRKINDAFDVDIYYELQPFVKLYDYEFAALGRYTGADNFKLMMIYLFIVKHINEKNKQPTWVSIQRIAEEFDLNENTIRRYIKTLLEQVGVLFRCGKKHLPTGYVQLYTRNMTEYIHRHR